MKSETTSPERVPAASVGGEAVTSVSTSRREAVRLGMSRAPGGLP
jgi:hypothetical protein